MNVVSIKFGCWISCLSSSFSWDKGPQEDERKRMGKGLSFFDAIKMFVVSRKSGVHNVDV